MGLFECVRFAQHFLICLRLRLGKDAFGFQLLRKLEFHIPRFDCRIERKVLRAFHNELDLCLRDLGFRERNLIENLGAFLNIDGAHLGVDRCVDFGRQQLLVDVLPAGRIPAIDWIV